MKAFIVQITFEEKTGFSEAGLKAAMVKNLEEIQLRLLDFSYHKDGKCFDIGFSSLKKTYSICECTIEVKDFSAMIPYHQVVLGGIQMLPKEYPYIEIFGIDPSLVEIE